MPKTSQEVTDEGFTSSPLPRPVPRRSAIDEYSDRELGLIVQWVAAGSLKTDEEIVAEVTRELGFDRRGRKIEKQLIQRRLREVALAGRMQR